MQSGMKTRPFPSYANVASTLALVLALGGVSYAAGVLPNNSVTSKTIKNGQVKAKDLAARSVGSKHVRSIAGSKLDANSVTGAQVDESTLAGVAQGTISNAAASAAGGTSQVPLHSVPGYGLVDITCEAGATMMSVRYRNDTNSPRFVAFGNTNSTTYYSDMIPSGSFVTFSAQDGTTFSLDVSPSPGSAAIAHFNISATAGGSVSGLPDLCYGSSTVVLGPGD